MSAANVTAPPEYFYQPDKRLPLARGQFVGHMPQCGVDQAFVGAATIAKSVESFKRQRLVRCHKAKEEIV